MTTRRLTEEELDRLTVQTIGQEGADEHKRLRLVCQDLPGDYDPWGNVIRWKDSRVAYPDCSCGCRFARWIVLQDGRESGDWLVCTNPKSHRAGLLTFEHQGCQMFEEEDCRHEYTFDGKCDECGEDVE